MDFYTLAKSIEKLSKATSLDTISDCIKNEEKNLLCHFKRKGYDFKNAEEMETFIQFVNLLKEWGMDTNLISYCTDSFAFGYIIPQISKEFDLLRFGENYNISIELKSDTTKEAQIKQLRRNKFYLHFLGEGKTRYYSISPNIESYLEYDAINDVISEIVPEDFVSILENQEYNNLNKEEMDKYFKIGNYLVSPFNDTDKFLKGEYFLTSHQESIVSAITDFDSEKKVYGIKGNPGTGKTLLVYHILKKLQDEGRRAVLIHGANLNDGQKFLNTKGYKIHQVKDTEKILKQCNEYDYIIIDEGQRLRGNFEDQTTQWGQLSEVVNNHDTKVVISMDSRQILSRTEDSEKSQRLYEAIKNYEKGEVFSLKDKFRYNIEMANFIKLILSHPADDTQIEKISNNNHNIQLKYFETRDDANEYLESIEREASSGGASSWQVLNYTKSNSRYKTGPEGLDYMNDLGLNSHSVIGQEFDNVIIQMDKNFSYKIFETTSDKGGEKIKKITEKLTYSYNYYPLEKMFYQNITRTREKLQIVIIENFTLFEKISSLLESY